MDTLPRKEKLFGKTLSELEAIVSLLGMPPFTARQLASWLYHKEAVSIDHMSDISLNNRQLLKSHYEIGIKPAQQETVSVDGTKKYLFASSAGYIESAYIPDGERATLCVSSQSGCRMGCSFCMTGKLGLRGNLTAGEILNQIRSIPESKKLTNVVYMGMGEPLDNTDEVLKSLEVLTEKWGYGWSPTRITVSTIGVLPGLELLLEKSKVHIAVSLHNPFHHEREQSMPSEKVWPVSEVIKLLSKHDFSGQRRISFEYIVFEGINDSAAHIKELTRLLSSLPCRVNLIRYHSTEGDKLRSPSESKMVAIRKALSSKGIITTIRSSRGEDIEAACGMLSARESQRSR